MAEDNHMWGMSPYESVKLDYMAARRPNGAAVTGIVLGSVGLFAGIGAWIFAPIFANAKSNGVKDLANAQFAANNAQIAALTGLLSTERAERVAQGTTISQTITDSIAGTQQGTQSQSTSVENSAMAQATAQLLTQSLLGNLSENAQKVQLYSAPAPCNCPGCGA